jgi:hypothetical protein
VPVNLIGFVEIVRPGFSSRMAQPLLSGFRVAGDDRELSHLGGVQLKPNRIKNIGRGLADEIRLRANSESHPNCRGRAGTLWLGWFA